MDTYIASFSLVNYYHSTLDSLGHGANNVTSYCAMMISDTVVPTSRGICQTTVQYGVTIVQFDVTVTIVASC